MNLDYLLDKAKWSKLSDKELNDVVLRIKNHQNEDADSLYTLLHILGKAGAIQHRVLLEQFLNYPKDPMISKIALQSLCDYWGLYRYYLEQIKAFIRGVEWDDGEQVKIIALSAAGTYIQESGDKSFLKVLLDVYDNEKEDDLNRSFAYEVITRTMGVKSKDLPSVRELATLSPDFINQEIIERARQEFSNSQRKVR